MRVGEVFLLQQPDRLDFQSGQSPGVTLLRAHDYGSIMEEKRGNSETPDASSKDESRRRSRRRIAAFAVVVVIATLIASNAVIWSLLERNRDDLAQARDDVSALQAYVGSEGNTSDHATITGKVAADVRASEEIHQQLVAIAGVVRNLESDVMKIRGDTVYSLSDPQYYPIPAYPGITSLSDLEAQLNSLRGNSLRGNSFGGWGASSSLGELDDRLDELARCVNSYMDAAAFGGYYSYSYCR